MARKERRDQPRIPCDIEVHLDEEHVEETEPVRMTLRTRNVNTRGAFFELPAPVEPPEPYSIVEFWNGRKLRLTVKGAPLCPEGEVLTCESEVRWVSRRGPKRRAVGVGVLFKDPSAQWQEALDLFLESLVTA